MDGWRKSSYSSQTNSCVEVHKDWHTSSYSSQTNSCVEVHKDWHTSSYSGSGNNNCVEVRGADNAVHVRDTKNRAGGTMEFPASAWSAFVVAESR